MRRFQHTAFVVFAVFWMCSCKPIAQESQVAAVPELKVVEVRLVSEASGVGVGVAPQPADKPVIVQIRVVGQGKGQKLNGRLVELATGVDAGKIARVWTESEPKSLLTFKPESGTWTPGRYALEVTLDDRLVSQQDIDIVAPSR